MRRTCKREEAAGDGAKAAPIGRLRGDIDDSTSVLWGEGMGGKNEDNTGYGPFYKRRGRWGRVEMTPTERWRVRCAVAAILWQVARDAGTSGAALVADRQAGVGFK
jgi:hypothetical protein